MRSSLWLKLTLSFVAVALAAVGLVAVLANRTVISQFDVYVTHGRQMQATGWVPSFAQYYAQTGSWNGVEALVNSWAEGVETEMGAEQHGRGGRHGSGRGGMDGTPGSRLLLADSQGTVVADSDGDLVGERLSAQDLAAGAPVVVDGQRVGTLVVAAVSAGGVGSAEESFLTEVNRALLWAGLLAVVLAVVLGLILSRQVTAPLRALTVAAEKMAAGDLAQRVTVPTRDEVGDLGGAFNTMVEALQRNEALRRQMTADIAHELRTPLSVIRGNLEAVLDGLYPLDAEHVAPVYEEVLLLERLVADLRLLSLAEAGELPLKLEPVNVGELAEGVLESARITAQEKGIALESEVSLNLPPVHGDVHRLRQVLNNLLGNALRYTPSSGHIAVTVGVVSSEMRLSVADSGPGIPDGDLPHVFERFYRGDRARTR
ncbi:MAG: HAMP domain-containing protein, partial [Chloroflexota bacterium]|nr:HAMP domain-containing protein [Chloroflexota bacterium]